MTLAKVVKGPIYIYSLMDDALSVGQTDVWPCLPNADAALPAEAGIKDLTSFSPCLYYLTVCDYQTGSREGHLALRCLREAVNGSHSWACSFRCVWGGLVKGRSCWHGRSRRGVITSCMNFLQTGRISLLRVALNIMTCFSWGVIRKISWTSRRMSAGDSKRTMHSYY